MSDLIFVVVFWNIFQKQRQERPDMLLIFSFKNIFTANAAIRGLLWRWTVCGKVSDSEPQTDQRCKRSH